MKIIEQYHEVLKFDAEPCKAIELAARTCYKSEDKIEEGSDIKLVKNLLNRNHFAMIEFGDATVKFITNRGVTHELVRHRLCSFAQESTRYVNYHKKGMEFIRPVWWEEWNLDQQCMWKHVMSTAENSYNYLINMGATLQEAREVLPNSLRAEIVVKANLREWRHIFELRCSKEAHPQMRALMLNILTEFYHRAPVIFEDLYNFALDSTRLK